MKIDLAKLKPEEKYKLLIQAIVPRPIAWVITRNKNGSMNLAPYSYFNLVSNEPPIVMLSIARKKDGSKKDTWANMEREKEFVIHIPTREDAEHVTRSAESFSVGESEVDRLGLRLSNLFEDTDMPGLSTTKLALFCELHSKHEIHGSYQELLFGEVKSVYVDEGAFREVDGMPKIGIKAIDPIARIGGHDYISMGDIITE